MLHRRPDLPLALASLVDRMLEKDPARRPQSMREVVAALDAEQAFREGFAEAPAPADEPRSEYLFVVQRPGKRLVALAALLAALAAGAVYANRDNLSSAWSATKKMLAGSDAARPASTPVVPGPPAKSPPRPPATARSVPVRRPTAPKATAGMAQATPSAPPGPAGAAGPVPERAPPVVVDALDGDGLFDATRPRSTAEAQAAQRQWAERLGQPVVETNSLGMQFAVIPPGRFLMGSAASDPAAAEHERPQVPATVSTPFRIAVHETTQSQWEAVMKTTPWMKTRQTHHYHARKGSDLPATYASWIEAMDFCRRLTDRERKSGRLAAGSEYTLPTEAQWEFACRAGTTTRYWFGDDPAELGRHAWYGGFEGDGNAAKERYAHRVGSKLPNAWGLFDVHGNAWEWCLDEYVANRRGGTDPVAPAIGSVRVLRGGGWDTGPNAARSANRMPLAGQQRSSRWSFRVAVVGVPPTKPLVLADDAAEPFDATRPRTAEEAASALRGFAERQGRPPVETNSIGMDLVLIPPGRFLRGGASDDPAAPVRDRVRAPVTVSHGFWIAARETTQAQWRSVMNSTPWAKKTYVLDDPAAPATYVTRGDAEVFCRRLTDSERKSGRLSAEFEYGLPTEAQWELACRAGTTTAYAFGDDPAELPKHGWFGGLDGNAAPQKDLHPKAVGRLAPNAWGLYDMHGNVYELCRDGYVELPPGGTDPCVTDRALPQVLRSGAWSRPAAACRSGFRASHSVEGGTAHIGFRVVVARVRPAVP